MEKKAWSIAHIKHKSKLQIDSRTNVKIKYK